MTYEVSESAYKFLPWGYRQEMKEYIERGKLTDPLLVAVLSGDLWAALECTEADGDHVITELARWVYRYAPQGCYGDLHKVAKWKAQKEKEAAKRLRISNG